MRKMARKLTATALALLVLLGALLAGLTVSADSIPTGFTPIYTPQDLRNIGNAGSYILMNDIDLSGFNDWIPIGSDAVPFSGILDGAGHEIKNLSITTGGTSSSGAGLFGVVSQIEIKDLSISGSIAVSDKTIVGGLIGAAIDNAILSDCRSSVDITVSGVAYRIGGFMGHSWGSITKIKNCHYEGNIEGIYSQPNSSAMIGGILGWCDYSQLVEIDASSNSGKIFVSGTTNAQVGGVLGWADSMQNMEIWSCRNTGAISALDGISVVGGIAGNVASSGSGNSFEIRGCYNMGEISGSLSAGGIIGSASLGNISDCYNVGKVSSVSSIGNDSYCKAGGIAGSITGDIQECYNIGPISSSGTAGGIAGAATNISNSYYLNTSVVAGGSGGTPLAEANMRQQSSFSGFDFSSVWGFEAGKRYPQLQSTPHNHTSTGTWIILTAPTCTETGEREQLCKHCGETAIYETIPANGHSPQLHTTTAPTCTTSGAGYEQCTVCSQNLGSKTIPATGHTTQHIIIPATCAANGVDYDKCATCGIDLSARTTLPAMGHNLGAWRVTRPESPTQAGEESRPCQNPGCTFAETREIRTQKGDNGTVNWDFIVPVTHQTTVPAGYLAITNAQLVHCLPPQVFVDSIANEEQNNNGRRPGPASRLTYFFMPRTTLSSPISRSSRTANSRSGTATRHRSLSRRTNPPRRSRPWRI